MADMSPRGPRVETQHMPLRMFSLKQCPPLTGRASPGIAGLHEKYGLDVRLHPIAAEFIQHRSRVHMGSVIERKKKSDLHNAFCASLLVFTTLPVQV